MEYGFLNLDLEADLSSLFNWNTKQVFAYLAIDYETPEHVVTPVFNSRADMENSNSATIWDAVMDSREEGRINLISAPPKYRFTDITGNFRGYNATYSLKWNVVPWVGIVQWGKSKEGKITLQQTEKIF